MPSAMRFRWGLTIMFVVTVGVGFLGCDFGPKLVKVTGTVTRHGKPLPDLTLVFMPEHGRPSMGQTDGDGKYELLYTVGTKGVVPGRYKVTVQYTPSNTADRSKLEAGLLPDDVKAIHDKYTDPKLTPLVFDIKSSQVLNVELD
jgi:hypothetical protein